MSEPQPSGSPWTPNLDEPAVRSAALQAFVDAARAAPVHEPKVSFDDVRAGVVSKVAGRRLSVGLGVVAAAAAALLAVNLSSFGRAGERDAGRVAVAESSPGEARVEVTPADREPLPDGRDHGESTGHLPGPEATPQLAASFEIAAADHTSRPATVLAANHVVVGPGSYRLSVVDGADAALEVTFTDEVDEARTLVLREGRLALDSRGESVIARLEYGVAAWRSADGSETAIALLVESETAVARRGDADAGADAAVAKVKAAPSAADLARQAEDALAAGDRGTAIKTLRKLVLRHARSAEARTGLLDLARLTKANGDVDGARCAYELYLQRWPAGTLASDVERSMHKLGDGPDCKGLRPVE